MHTVLIVVHLLIAIALIGVVLLQRSEGGALGIGGGSSGGAGLGGLFSPRGAASTLTRTTAVLAFLFLVTSMSLTYISLGTGQSDSLLQTGQPGAPSGPPTLPSGEPPTLPSAPPADQAPAAPAGPPALPGAPAEQPEN